MEFGHFNIMSWKPSADGGASSGTSASSELVVVR